VRETAAGFLTAWEEGDARAAAALTDDPGAARAGAVAITAAKGHHAVRREADDGGGGHHRPADNRQSLTVPHDRPVPEIAREVAAFPR
jgi:hypothetical protein